MLTSKKYNTVSPYTLELLGIETRKYKTITPGKKDKRHQQAQLQQLNIGVLRAIPQPIIGKTLQKETKAIMRHHLGQQQAPLERFSDLAAKRGPFAVARHDDAQFNAQDSYGDATATSLKKECHIDSLPKALCLSVNRGQSLANMF
ncbi:uncharacterized protein PHALS_11312 [Plasmopara halstedii]|uniref:Uncharacterized protein n=1 Tax=Plasmopara halstedii TaxID=4781 RepID=A0A0P1AJK5_PLAHL|nr:uncharacterized protein PHALS_11312 [Plasmopara halstedii]CEG41149.1 hypothetical protein PHALS_11312 [Plasmopara halstedii]|eukprot:XP_024577518.1 hypothetical protein PHALS_11312 [Plasmopara halstedii]